MKINFTKMHGIGNDYICIDCYTNDNTIENLSEFAKLISDRHYGVGSDGVILIYKSSSADFKIRIFNSNGIEAGISGNGLRCLGKYVYDKGLTIKEEITVETLAGIKTIYLNIENGKVKTVKVDMGVPIFEAKKIPVVSREEIVRNLEIKAYDKNFKFTCVSFGNPHAVTFVENVDEFGVKKYGAIIEKDGYFPKKANVEFVEIIDKSHIKIRVWKRNLGETLASGTGACAAAIASTLNRYTKEKVEVELLGGYLNIEWNKENNHIYMEGPATTVFEGRLNQADFEETLKIQDEN